MKFQAVAEKTAINFRGLLFCHTWYIYWTWCVSHKNTTPKKISLLYPGSGLCQQKPAFAVPKV